MKFHGLGLKLVQLIQHALDRVERPAETRLIKRSHLVFRVVPEAPYFVECRHDVGWEQFLEGVDCAEAPVLVRLSGSTFVFANDFQ